MERSKKSCKTDECKDRLSNLPLEILRHVLSFLGTVYVVRTCLLSQKWKTLWKSTPTLLFEEYVDVYDEWWQTLVNQVLIFNRSDIQKLSYERDLSNRSSMFDISVRTAVSRNVKQLDLKTYLSDDYDPPKSLSLPSCVITSESLEALSIEHEHPIDYLKIKLPTSVRLRHLKVLYLHGLYVPDDTFNSLVSSDSCPLLEELGLRSCRGLDKFVLVSKTLKRLFISNCFTKIDHGVDCMMKISAPSLETVRWRGFMGKGNDCVFDNLVSLTEVFLMPHFNCNKQQMVYNLIKFLGGLCNARKLFIDISNAKYDKDGLIAINGENDFRVNMVNLLPNLTYMESGTNFSKYELPLILFLLKNASHLRHLVIYNVHRSPRRANENCEDDHFDGEKEWDHVESSKINLFNHLEICKVTLQKKTKTATRFMAHLLQNSPLLKEVDFSVVSNKD